MRTASAAPQHTDNKKPSQDSISALYLCLFTVGLETRSDSFQSGPLSGDEAEKLMIVHCAMGFGFKLNSDSQVK